jgi:hypothetical protein
VQPLRVDDDEPVPVPRDQPPPELVGGATEFALRHHCCPACGRALRRRAGDHKTGGVEIGGGRDPLGLGPIYGRMDITRAAADLGYTPEYDLARGVADYVESLRRLDLQPTPQESESSWSTGSALPGAGPSRT